MSTSIFWGKEMHVLLFLGTRLDMVVNGVWSHCRLDRSKEYKGYQRKRGQQSVK